MDQITKKSTLEWKRERDEWAEDGYGTSYERHRDEKPLAEVIAPLIEQLQSYDAMRLQLENKGGHIHLLEQLTTILTKPIVVLTRWGEESACLADQKSLRELIRSTGRFQLHLDVRKLDHGLPVYYLFRKEEDYWFDYSLIVEDLYQSPGFPLMDERFVKLMRMGHEEYALRLSQFRPQLSHVYSAREKIDEKWYDRLLYQVGRYVFQAAWHDDQRPGFLTARSFALRQFRQALELLYLCLSGELCELRSAVDDDLLLFFDKVYPQPAILHFVKKLIKMEGSEINDIPQATLSLYAKLSLAFNRFLSTKVTWGIHPCTSPLFKLVFANLNRLDMVADRVGKEGAVTEAAKQLEQTAGDIIGCILGKE